MKCFYPFYKDGKCGFIDTFGNEIIPPTYEYGTHSTEGLAVARLNGAYGFIDSNNDFVVPFCHEDVNNVREKSFFSWGKGFFNLDNKCFFECKENIITSGFHEGFACLTRPPNMTTNRQISTPTCGLISRTGDWMIAPQTEYCFYQEVSQGLLAASMWMKSGAMLSGFLNTSGEIAIPFIFTEVRSFSEDLAPVREAEPNGKCGYINQKGNYVISPKFNDAWEFSEGLAAVAITKKSTKIGFINKEGEFVISPQFKKVEKFHADCAPVLDGRNHKCGLINTKGEFILEPCFSEIKYCSADIYKVIDNQKKLYYINSFGNWIYKTE
jgi:KWG Leptospira.